MNYNIPRSNKGTITIRVMCALVFLLFTFSWLYFFQSDMLTVAQHVLSKGQTHYDSTVGTIVITLLLMLIQMAVFAIFRLTRRHALTYAPSFLLLALITDLGEPIVEHHVNGTWLWLFPLALVVWGLVSWWARSYQSYESRVGQTRVLWSNLLLMAAMMAGVGAIGNTNAVFHYRAHMECSLCEHDYDEVLACGAKSLESDPSMLMLRMYALSKKQELGERLFEYTVNGTSADILPLNSRSVTVVYPADSIFSYLGAWPRSYMSSMQYVDALIRHGQATPPVPDYLLCGYLIDRDLDAFAKNVGRFYTVNDSLPKHYREALTLYTHLRSTPVVDYHHAVMDEDFANFRELEKEYPQASERKSKVFSRFGSTYWYYYEYHRAD